MVFLKKFIVVFLVVFTGSGLFSQTSRLFTNLNFDVLYFYNDIDQFCYRYDQYPRFNPDNSDFYSTKTTKSKDAKNKTANKVALTKETIAGIVGGTFAGAGGISLATTIIFGVLSIVYYNDSLISYSTYLDYSSAGSYTQRDIDFIYNDFLHKSTDASRYLYMTIGFGSLTLVCAAVSSIVLVYFFKPPVKKVEIFFDYDKNETLICGAFCISI